MTKAHLKRPSNAKNFAAYREQQRLAKQAFIAEVCEQIGIADRLEAVRALPMEDKKALVLQLNFAGMSLPDCAKIVGIGHSTADRWFTENPEEMQRMIRGMLAAESLKEVGPTFSNLKDLRYSGNAETSRKANLDVLAVAGMGPHAAPGITVNVNAKNAHLSLVPLGEIESTLKELAALVGPTAEKIVDAELVSVKDLNGNGKTRKADVPDLAAASPGADQGPVGGAPPATDQPTG